MEVVEGGYKIVYNDAVIYVREAQQYTVTLAAYESDTFLGSIGKVSVWETAESYSYSYPAYVVYNNKLYNRNAIEGSYTETVHGKITGNTTVNVGYTAVSGYDSATAITLLEPDGYTVDGASKGGATKNITYGLIGQGDYTVIARYKGAVAANCGNEPIDRFAESDEWTEVKTTFSNKNTESTEFTMTADENGYIDYVVLVRTGDAQSTLTYTKTGDGTGTVKVGSKELNEDEAFTAVVGSAQTIIVAAGENSYIKSIKFNMPAADVTINVTFNKLRTVSLARAVISTKENGDNSNPGTVSGEVTVSAPEATVPITANTARGYRFVKFIYVETPKEGISASEILRYASEEDLKNYLQEFGEIKEDISNTSVDEIKGMYGTVTGALAVPNNNVTVIAVFEELEPIKISAGNVMGGALLPTVDEVYPGDTFSVNVTADEGYYEPESIIVLYNDIPLSEINGEYTVPYPATEAEYPGTIILSADFEAIPYNEVKNVVSNISDPDYGNLGDNCGTITVSGTGADNKAYKDAVITVSAVAENGYRVSGIKVTKIGGGEITSNNADSITFTMPDYPVMVTAEFEWINRLPYDVVINAEKAEEFTAGAENGETSASLWIDELKGLGLAYKPYVSVTVNHNNSESTKTAICSTTIAGVHL